MSPEELEDKPIEKDVIVDDGDGEDDVTDQHHPAYDIHWYGANLDIHGLVRRFDNDRIYWPDFQRKFVWNQKQSSRLIESILIGLPIPSIFLYKENDNERSFIIDGLQRMITLSAFKNGHWPSINPENRFDENKGKLFRLTGLPKDSHFLYKTYNELDENDRERFDNTLIHVLFIEQRSPNDNHNSAFHIFERLNSGGTPLKAQEMLNALFGGSLREHLYKLAQEELWGRMFGRPHKRAKDQELILRFLSLLNWEEKYKPPMKLFLRDFMKEHRKANEATLSNFTNQFIGTLTRINQALGDDAFRPSGTRTFSAPYFDAFMVAVANSPNASDEAIKTAYSNLRKNEIFEDFTRAATTDTSTIKGRLRMVKEAING